MHVSGEDDIARLAMSFNQMAEALQSQIRKLVELSRVQRTFVSDVSHELRTPLTTVRMAGDVLHDARASFDPVTATRGRAAAERARPVREPARRPARDQPVRRRRRGARPRGHQPRRHRPPGGRLDGTDGPAAWGHRDGPRRRRVHGRGRRDDGSSGSCATWSRTRSTTPTRSGVSIRLAADGGATALTVRDHGVGLQPGQSAMVFNRFWRGDPARARTTGGTGLGLAIALEDARLHGGWLQAWGTPGGGSPVPAHPAAPRRRPADAQPAPARAARHPGGRPMSAPRSRASWLLLGVVAGARLGRVHHPAGERSHPPRRPRTGRTDRRTRRTSTRRGRRRTEVPPPIVSGFLVAMQANPLSTSVARTFLSEHARGTWKPNRGTIVYEAFIGAADQRRAPRCGSPTHVASTHAAGGAVAHLATRRRSTSGWSPRTVSGASTTRSTRWSVPSSFFDRSFARFNLYFYDQTGRTLLPDPVFIPRGEQSATNLVRGLLAGPGARSPT